MGCRVITGELATSKFDIRYACEVVRADVAFSKNRIDLPALRAARAPLCRTCLDWSARRSHLAGSLGRAFLSQFEALNWARRAPGTRVVTFSAKGEAQFAQLCAG